MQEIKRVIKETERQRITKIITKSREHEGKVQLGLEELEAEIDAYLAKDPQNAKATEVQLVVTEGKHRMVRRMLHNAGHTVLFLHRIRYGGILLSELKENEVRAINDTEREWFTSWAVQRDAALKATMDRRYEIGKPGNGQLKEESKLAVKFVREEATAILTKMRKKRKIVLEKSGLLWPENHVTVEIEEGPEGEVEKIIKSPDIRAQKVKEIIAEKLNEYSATRELPLSKRALKMATKAINKLLLFDRKEEKKWVRLRKNMLKKQTK